MPSPSETQFPPLALDSASENEIGKRGLQRRAESKPFLQAAKLVKIVVNR